MQRFVDLYLSIWYDFQMAVSRHTMHKWREGVGSTTYGKVCPTDALSRPDWHNPDRIARTLGGDIQRPWTYFVGWIGGPVKIGRALDPYARMANIQNACPYRTHLWAVSSYPVHEERRLHKRFCERRLMREWFDWHPDLEAMMAALNGARAAELTVIRQS